MLANPDFVTLNSYAGSQSRIVISVKAIGGFSGNITLKVEHYGIIGDIKFVLDPPQIILPSDEEVQSILTLRVISLVSPGKYNIDIIGVADNSIQHLVRVVLAVSAS